MRAVLRYLQIWIALAKNCFVRQLEYKLNFTGRVIIELVWISSQVLFFQAAFRFVPQLGGWSESQIWFFVGTLFLVDGLMMVMLHDNQNRFGQMMRLGVFDFYLLYPLSSLFLASFRMVNVISFVNVAVAIAVVVWASMLPGLHLGLGDWMVWLVYMLLGAIQVGALGILVCSMAFWTTQSSNSMWLFYELYRLAWRPESLYATWLRRILLSVFPAAFFVSIPVQLALSKRGGVWFVYPWIFTILIIALDLWVWKRGLRRYEGALS